MAHHAPPLSACANCGYPFPPDTPAEFCPRCGQQNHDLNISFGHLVEETLEGVFHFDGKVFRTAGLLLFRPGVLTRRFLEGHRVPYVPPVRLYIFLSFVFFFLLSVFTKPGHGQERSVAQLANTLPAQTSDPQLVQQILHDMAAASPARRDSLQRLLRDSLRQRQAQGRNLGLTYTPALSDTARSGPAPRRANFSVNLPGLDMRSDEVAKLPAEPSAAQIDSIIRSRGAVPGFWNRLGVKRAVRWRDVTREDAVHQALRGLSILIFLIMPLAALLLKGAYFRQRRHYISHLIFTVHIHCFLFVYFAVVLLLSQLSFMAWAEDLPLLLPAVYFVVALRNFYQQTWLKTGFKALLLGFSYSFTLTLVVVLVAMAGLIMF